MNLLQFISAIVGSMVSWPVAVIIIFVILKKPIQNDLIPRLRTFEGLGQKLTFGEALATTETSVGTAVEGIARDGGPEVIKDLEEGSALEGRREDSLARDAETNPSFAMLAAYERLTHALADLVGTHLPARPTARSQSPVNGLRELERHGVVKADFVRAVSELRDLRNRVAHGQDNPTSGEAVAYVRLAQELAAAALVLATLPSGRNREGTK